jgi:creatinine amidohydrolase
VKLLKYYLHEMSYVEVQQAISKTDTVIVPLGALEGHGPHNPTGCCFILAHESARLVGAKTGVPVTPTIPFGISKNLQNFSGTIDVKPETLKELVRDVSVSLIRHGFKRIIFFSAHDGLNVAALTEVSEELRGRTGALFAVLHLWGLVGQLSPGVTSAPGVAGGHGGDPTTSVMLHLAPSLVDMRQAKWEPLKQPLQGMKTESHSAHEFRKVRISVPLYADEVSATGVAADPTKASKERGEQLFKMLTDYLVDFVRSFSCMRLPEQPKIDTMSN